MLSAKAQLYNYMGCRVYPSPPTPPPCPTRRNLGVSLRFTRLPAMRVGPTSMFRPRPRRCRRHLYSGPRGARLRGCSMAPTRIRGDRMTSSSSDKTLIFLLFPRRFSTSCATRGSGICRATTWTNWSSRYPLSDNAYLYCTHIAFIGKVNSHAAVYPHARHGT